jgi:glycosyltransferase involved in cell wall biosynthesis
MFRSSGIIFLCLSLVVIAAAGFPKTVDDVVFQSKICIVLKSELLIKNTETGYVYLNLAQTLKEAGHDVTILTSEDLSSANLGDKLMSAQLAGIKFQTVAKLSLKHTFTAQHSWESYELYEFLKTQQYDIVHIPDWEGYGYYSVLAKEQGIAFPHTVFVVGLQAPHMWSKIGNLEHISNTEALEKDFAQRQVAELADVVISSSQFMLNWASENGWKLPEKTYVQPSLISSRIPSKTSLVGASKPSEIVFFGDLMPCEGIILFCDAIDRLFTTHRASLPSDFRITFLGKEMKVQGISSTEYIQRRSAKWDDLTVNIISNKDNIESLRYLLSSSNRLAVVATEMANSPLRIQELLHANIPFIASKVGGISELISSEDAQKILFETREDKLAEKMIQIILNGIHKVKSLISYEENKNEWIQYHASLRESYVENADLLESPLVSVVIASFNRPEMLRQAVASIENQDYSNIEVILVDDASTSIEAKAEISNLKSLFEMRNWKIIQLFENSYLGKVRNIGVQNAAGKYILFLDDDNVAKANEISTFVKVAEKTGADLLTSAQDFFSGIDVPSDDETPLSRRVPLGGDVATGFFYNCYGDANSFVKRSSFLLIGGFTEEYQIGYEDYEFFNHALLSGLKMQVVPEPLFWYRLSLNTMSTNTPLYKNRMRAIRPYLASNPQLSNLLLLAHNMHYDDIDTPFMGVLQTTNCSALTNCSDCSQYAGCGWCPANQQCQAGGEHGPLDAASNCTGGTGGWSVNATQCCPVTKDCEKCAKVEGCGFCSDSSTCERSDKGNAFNLHSKCHTGSSLKTSTDDCSSDSDKRKIAIIVGCSVAGGLIVLAAIATAIFCIYHRTNKRRGYTAINQG